MRNSAVSHAMVTDFNIQISVTDPSRGTKGRLRAGVGWAWPPLSRRETKASWIRAFPACPRSSFSDGGWLSTCKVRGKGQRSTEAPSVGPDQRWALSSRGRWPHPRTFRSLQLGGGLFLGSGGWSPGRLHDTLQCSGCLHVERSSLQNASNAEMGETGSGLQRAMT